MNGVRRDSMLLSVMADASRVVAGWPGPAVRAAGGAASDQSETIGTHAAYVL